MKNFFKKLKDINNIKYEKIEANIHAIGTLSWQALLVGAVSLAILIIYPKIEKRIPPSLIAVVVVSYYFVLSCEIKLNDLSRQTVILNNENTDLQNQLDKLKSFSNVDKTFQKNNMLKRAGQVIETQAVAPETVDTHTTKSTKKRVFKYAIGF